MKNWCSVMENENCLKRVRFAFQEVERCTVYGLEKNNSKIKIPSWHHISPFDTLSCQLHVSMISRPL